MTDHRGHTPMLVDNVRKLERCKTCGEARQRGHLWLGACPGPAARDETPALGVTETLRGGLYRGRAKAGA